LRALQSGKRANWIGTTVVQRGILDFEQLALKRDMPKSPFVWRKLWRVPSAGIELSKPTFLFAGTTSIGNVRMRALRRARVAEPRRKL
jgi:hypothetical protein